MYSKPEYAYSGSKSSQKIWPEYMYSGMEYGGHCLAIHKASFRRHEGRSRFFDFFDVRPLRGGAGRGSNAICLFELDVRFFFRARSELGGPSVAVRGGVQLGGVSASSMWVF